MKSSKSRWLIATTIVLAATLSGCSTAEKNKAPEPAPAPAPAPAPPPPPPSFVVEDVWFEFDSAKLKPAAVNRLDTIAIELVGQPTVPYEVVGHTDSIGSEAYNQGLSVERATSVSEYLIGRDVPASRLSVKGMGESMPIAPNNTKEGRAKNRRVEVRPIK